MITDENEKQEEESQEEVSPPSQVVEEGFSREQVVQLVQQAIRAKETLDAGREREAFLDRLYQEDPAQWAHEVKNEQQEQRRLEELQRTTRSQVEEEYYRGVFSEVLPAFQPLLSELTPEERSYLDPDNPIWKSDGQYMAALFTTLSNKQVERETAKYKKGEAEEGIAMLRDAANANQVVAPDLPSGSPSPEGISVLGLNARDTLRDALVSTVGASWESDDSD